MKFRWRWAAALAVVASGVLPGAAGAQSAEDLLREAAAKPQVSLMPNVPQTRVRRSLAPVSVPGPALGESVTPVGGAARPGSTGAKPKLTIRCRRRARSWTCTVRRPGARRAMVRCTARTKARARSRCLSRAAERIGPTARAAGLDWQGFPAQGMAAVGRLIILYPSYYGTCSGTVVARTLVLAAGHCFDPKGGQTATNVLFIPGATWTATDQPLDHAAPYGTWKATNWWQPGGWQSSRDASLDWGLVEIPPADNGQPISAITGAWPIQPNLRFGAGAQIYAVGYPSSGYWATSQAGRGRGQYACSTTWDGEWQYVGTGWELFTQCTMNRGASGGPWFVKLGDGSWVIGGINNRCKSRFDNAQSYCDPHSDWMRSSYLDSRFVEFWNSVQPLLRYR